LQLISVISCCEPNQSKRLQGRPEPYLLFGCAREPWILQFLILISATVSIPLSYFSILVRRDFLHSCRKCNLIFFRPWIGIVVVVFHPVRFNPSSCFATIVLFPVRRTPDINVYRGFAGASPWVEPTEFAKPWCNRDCNRTRFTLQKRRGNFIQTTIIIIVQHRPFSNHVLKTVATAVTMEWRNVNVGASCILWI